MRIRLFITALATVGALLATGVSASAQPASPITVHLHVYQATAIAGSKIHGVATFTNSSSKPVLVQACAADGWLFVGLSNSKITFGASRVTTKCAPSVRLKPGINRFAVTLSTLYSACVQSKSPFVPRCTKNGPPPLPKGHYTTTVITIGLPTGTLNPPPVPVTIR